MKPGSLRLATNPTAPETPRVYAEPVLITPAWIMKYYILDLSPRNSLVRYLVEKGHTVFMISWKNPDAADRELSLGDYVKLGFLDALAEVRRLIPQRRVHAVGYCIGGTLLAIAAAMLAAGGDTSLASLTLLAAQVDFSEPGELSVFITPSQIAMLEAMMSKSGVLESERMGAVRGDHELTLFTRQSTYGRNAGIDQCLEELAGDDVGPVLESIDDFRFDLPKYRAISLLVTLRDKDGIGL